MVVIGRTAFVSSYSGEPNRFHSHVLNRHLQPFDWESERELTGIHLSRVGKLTAPQGFLLNPP